MTDRERWLAERPKPKPPPPRYVRCPRCRFVTITGAPMARHIRNRHA